MALPTKTDLSTLVLPGVKPVEYFKIANVFQDEFDALPSEFQVHYDYDPETRTYTLDELEWLKWRKHGPYHRHPEDSRYIEYTLGGSDIAVLFDGSELSEQLFLYDGQHGSNFKSAIELFYEKTGKKFEMKEKKKIGSDVLWVGHNEEPSIRNLFKRNYCKDHPLDIVKVINDCHMYQCGMRDHTGKLLYPFVLCDLDGLVEINGVTGILECKTCNKGSEDYKLWKKHIVPLKYYLQVCWYMLCMNLPYGYIVAKWGLLPSECVYIYIERNFDVENLIIKMAQDFLEAVKTKQPPDLNNQNLDRLFVYWRKKMGNPKPDAPVKMLGREYKDTALTLSMIGTSIKDFQQKESDLKKQRRDILTKQIFPVMGQSSEALVDFSPSSNMRIKLHNGSKKMVDSDSLKLYDPELYHQYVKEVFDEKLFIEEMTDTDLGDEFIVDSNVLTDSKLEYCEVRLEPKNKK